MGALFCYAECSMNTVIFDFDGVIADTYDMVHAMTVRDNPDVTPEQHRTLYEGNINDRLKEQTFLKVVLPDEEWFEIYQQDLLQQKLMPHIEQAIADLAGRYQLLMVTSTLSMLAHKFLAQHQLHSYFAEIFGQDIHGSKVEKFKMIFAKYSLKPEQCLMVTDTTGDIKEAAAVGVKSVAIAGGYHLAETLRQAEPWKFIDTAGELVATVDNYFQQAS